MNITKTKAIKAPSDPQDAYDDEHVYKKVGFFVMSPNKLIIIIKIFFFQMAHVVLLQCKY